MFEINNFYISGTNGKGVEVGVIAGSVVAAVAVTLIVAAILIVVMRCDSFYLVKLSCSNSCFTDSALAILSCRRRRKDNPDTPNVPKEFSRGI